MTEIHIVDPGNYEWIERCIIDGRKSIDDRHKSTADRHANPNRNGDRSRRNLPIIGIDGEGGGPLGVQQPYLLMRAATADGKSWELFKDNKPLTTTDCLEFVLSLPQDYMIFGFSFGYDVTQIVKSEMSRERLRFLFQMRPVKKGVVKGRERQETKVTSLLAELSVSGIGPGSARALFDARTFDGAAVYDWSIEDKFDTDFLHTIRERESIQAWTFWRGYALKCLPGRRFSVARAERVKDDEGRLKDVIVAGSRREIYDCFGFFQTGFVNTLKTFAVTDAADIADIDAFKQRRSSFMSVDDEIRRYCHRECVLASKLMTKFRGMLLANENAYNEKKAGETGGKSEFVKLLRLWFKDPWGAGSVAQAMLKSLYYPVRPRLDQNSRWKLVKPTPEGKKPRKPRKASSPSRKAPVRPLRPRALENMAMMAYYGGRFETSATGRIDTQVNEYDINSAYPYNMKKLPCPLCTTWKWTATRPAKGALYVGLLDFFHPNAGRQRWCGFPWRTKEGALIFPVSGRGCYWSCEIEAAEDVFDAKVKWLGGFVAEKKCDHDFNDFVPDIYDFRAELEKKEKGSGIGLKLGLNSIYGKECQGIGSAGFRDMIAAGLITARTRAMLIRAMGKHPEDVLMLATDAIYSTRKLDLPTSGVKVLGEWEAATYDNGMFIIMPGLFKMFPGPNQEEKLQKIKRRGIGAKALEKYMPKLIESWDAAKGKIEYYKSAIGAPIVWISNPNFRSARHSLSMETSADDSGLLTTAGIWQHDCDDPNCEHDKGPCGKQQKDCTDPKCKHPNGTCGRRRMAFSWAAAKRAPWCNIVTGKTVSYHVRHEPNQGDPCEMSYPS